MKKIGSRETSIYAISWLFCNVVLYIGYHSMYKTGCDASRNHYKCTHIGDVKSVYKEKI